MTLRITQKDFPVGDHNYRVRKLDARTGTWLFGFLMAKAHPDGEPANMQELVTAFHLLEKKDYDRVQTEVLLKVALVENIEGKEFESMVLAPSQSGMAHDFLRDDTRAVYELTDMAVVFNLTPFFEKSSGSETQNPQDTIQPSAQPSTVS